jgi:putative heme iron utilization protein
VRTGRHSLHAAEAVRQARWLADSAEIGWLTSFGPDQASFGSPVNVSTDRDGAPLFLVPGDSPHHRILAATGAAHLLLTEPAMGGLLPRDAARLTLPGCARPLPSSQTALARAFLQEARAVNDAAVCLFRLEVTGARYQPRPGTQLPSLALTGAEWRRARPGGLPAGLAALTDHLNREHNDALRELCTALSGPVDTHAVVILGLRPWRLDLAALTPTGVTSVRLAFRRPVATPADLAADLLGRIGRLGWGRCTRTSIRRSGLNVSTRPR